ncbi:hypothetical protein CP533_5633 [Ophiocordyceps camponoti-saundersi (nom. inval.)]|nr:hypothetical protein CP533_5633 [Ophiocordyceps camponoti-saundersi (nom. inval.)]
MTLPSTPFSPPLAEAKMRSVDDVSTSCNVCLASRTREVGCATWENSEEAGNALGAPFRSSTEASMANAHVPAFQPQRRQRGNN